MEKKDKGEKALWFSFHGSPALLKDSFRHQEVEFVQVQINMQVEYPIVHSGGCIKYSEI